jgi:Holliday junction DNA helicase RuvA
MMDFVEGKLVAKSPSHVVVNCGGLGVRGIISLSTYDDLPSVGADVRLWTYLQMREDEITVFGFSTQEERWMFQHLISVNGVGPRLAITMLSAAKADLLRRAISEGDSDRLKTIPKIGSKIADRVVLELKKKLGEEHPEFAASAPTGPAGEIRAAVDALNALGFSRAEAEKAVDNARKQGATGVEELVKLSLRMS